MLIKSPILFVGDWFGLLDFFSFDGLSFFLFSSELFLLASDGFNISGDEQVDHDVPLLVDGEDSSQNHNFSGEHPEDSGDGFGDSVVAGDDNINEFQGSVSVAQGNGGDVDVGSFNDGLVVVLGVSDDQESGLLEFFGQLIGQGPWDPSGGGVGSASGVLPEFVDGSLPVLFGTDHDDFGEVGDRGNDSGGEFNFVISFVNFEDIVAG